MDRLLAEKIDDLADAFMVLIIATGFLEVSLLDSVSLHTRDSYDVGLTPMAAVRGYRTSTKKD